MSCPMLGSEDTGINHTEKHLDESDIWWKVKSLKAKTTLLCGGKGYGSIPEKHLSNPLNPTLPETSVFH